MKLRNPNFPDPVVAFVEANKASIATFFSDQAVSEFISFDDVRAAFPTATDPVTGTKGLTDGTIAEVCAALGVEVME